MHMQYGPLPLAEQVTLAHEHYAKLDHLGMVEEMPNAGQKITTPDPYSYALGWIVANAIVQRRYATSGIDVLPIFHPQSGWDRFLISRRVACRHHADESADRFGTLLLSANGGLKLVTQDGTHQHEFGESLRRDPESAIDGLLNLIPAPALGRLDHSRCWHTRAAHSYPLLYDIVTHRLLADSGLIAAREIFIDDARTESGYHPLHIHSAGRITGLNYDWFAVESGFGLVYVRLHGKSAVYRSERETWRSEAIPSEDLSWSPLARKLTGWLRLEPDRPAPGS